MHMRAHMPRFFSIAHLTQDPLCTWRCRRIPTARNALPPAMRIVLKMDPPGSKTALIRPLKSISAPIMIR